VEIANMYNGIKVRIRLISGFIPENNNNLKSSVK